MSIFRAAYFKNPIEEEDMDAAIKKLKTILELDENENGWDDLSSDDEEDDEPNAEENQYVVEKVLAEKVDKGKLKFLTKWFGYEDEDDQTWEPLENFFTKGAKMAIFLFYKKKWRKQLKKQGNAGSSSDAVAHEKKEKREKERKRENERKRDEMRMSNDENKSPPSTSKQNIDRGAGSSKHKEKSHHSSKSASSKHASNKQFSGEERSQSPKNAPSASSSSMHPKHGRITKKIRPKTASQINAKRLKNNYQPSDGIYINKDDLKCRRELQQQQAKEAKELRIKKQLEERRQAEIREREKAEQERRMAREKAEELKAQENLQKFYAEIVGSSDEEEDDE